MKKAALIILGLAAAAGALAIPGFGQATPSFSVQDLNGNTVTAAGLRGKVVVVNFWASWCPPCRAEIPDFVAFYELNKTRGLEILGLSLDQLTPVQLLSFVKKNKMTYPIAFADGKIVSAFNPGDAIPTTFILDKHGRVRHKQVGGLDKDTLESWFKKLIAEN